MSGESRDVEHIAPDSASEPEPDRGTWTYVESTIIMTTVRVVAPFVMTFGLFISLHGADSPGGGFQGGIILASMLIMVAFSFGVAPTRDWIDPRVIAGLIAGGGLLFAAIGVGTLALGGSFLEYWVYGGKYASKYAIELVELGIAATVVGIITSIFFLLERGWELQQEPAETEQGESR